MYKVYIKNFMRNGSLITTEEQMFAVPSASGFPVQKPIVKASEDAAENFTFSMESNSPYYDALLQHKTLIRVVYDGPNGTDTDIIFDGKVLNISSSTVYHTKNITCAGYYVFFNDSYYEGKQEKHRSKMTVAQYYSAIISNHNTMVPEKAVTQGTVGVTLPTEQDKYEPTAWTQTSGLLGNLTSNYGGHMIVQSSGNIRTLNWYKYYSRDRGDGLRPKVTVGKNILDISADYTGDNVFTRVIPIGATDSNGKTIYIDGYNNYSGKSMSVPYIRNLYTDQELTDEFHSYTDYRDAETNFGVIYKTVTFSDADTQEKLWNYVKKWIKDSYFGIATSFTVKAIDLHITDNNYPKILIGECVDVTYLIVRNGTTVWETKKLVCKNVSYDLFNPENNSYTFSIPSDLLDHSKTSKKSSKNQTASASGSNNKTIPKGDEDEEITWRKVWHMIGTLNGDPDYEGTTAALSFYNNGELSGTVYCVDPNEITSGSAAELNEKKFAARLIGKITLSGKSVKWVAISSDRGIFAYTENRYVKSVSHWYQKQKGYKYIDSGGEESISSFETIARLIEQDTDSSWGGSTAASSFRNNGKISGSISKAYDPDKCTAQEAAADPSLVFSADIVGKFTLNSVTKYVAISSEYGIFGFNASARGIIPATHWYSQVKGCTYDNASGLVVEDKTGDIYATTDGNPDEKKSVWLKTRELTGKGSQGEVLIGIDTTAQGDQWRIKLNVPIQYTDESGATKIADGFVSASDINLPSIPSFKTKFVVTDVLIAGKVNAADISADIAYIRKINSNSVSANTYVASATGMFAKVDASEIYSNYIYYKETGMSALNIMSKIQAAYNFATDANNPGKIYLQGKAMNAQASAWVNLANFNIADTQFYKDNIDSAKKGVSIGAIIYSPTSGDSPDRTLNPGQWAKSQGTYTDQNGQTKTTDSYKLIKARELRLRTPQSAVRPTTSNQTIVPGSDSGGVAYDGLAQVVVEGSTNLVQGNIKNGVTIFGVTGNYAPALEEETVYPTRSTQVAVPSTGYYGLSKVTVGAVIYSGLSADVIKSGTVVKIGTSNDTTSIANITGTYSGGGSYPSGNVHGSSEIWDPSASTEYSSGYTIPAGGSLAFVPWIYWNHGDGTGNWFYGNQFTMNAGTSNPYPSSVTMEYLYSEEIEGEKYYVFSTTKNLGLRAGQTKTFHY